MIFFNNWDLGFVIYLFLGLVGWDVRYFIIRVVDEFV